MSVLPNVAGCCSIESICAVKKSSVNRKLIKPGPAISTFETYIGSTSSLPTISCATARGFFFADFARSIATFVVMSPCVSSFGFSNVSFARPSYESERRAAPTFLERYFFILFQFFSSLKSVSLFDVFSLKV